VASRIEVIGMADTPPLDEAVARAPARGLPEKVIFAGRPETRREERAGGVSFALGDLGRMEGT